MKTDKEFKNPSIIIDTQNHVGSKEKVSVTEAQQKMKRIAETTLDRPNQILTKVASELPNEVSALLPSEDTCRHNL